MAGTAASAAGGVSARGERSRPEAMLEDAIEDVLRVTSRWVWLVVALGLVGVVLAIVALLNRMFIFVYVAFTHSWSSLSSAFVFMALVAVVVVAFKALERAAAGSASGYLARRLAVPAVLATAQRAGMPETLAANAIRDVETVRTAMAGAAARAAVQAVVTPPLVALAFVIHWAYGALSLFFCVVLGVISVLITRASRQAAETGGAGRARAAGLAADAMRSGEAVLAMGMLPRLAGQWIEVGTASAGEAWVAERRAARLRTLMEAMLGSLRGSFLVVSAVLALNGEIMTALAVSAMFVVLRIPEPFAAIGDNAHELAEGQAAWRRLKALVRGSPLPPDGLAFPCREGRLVAERVAFGFRGPAPPLFRSLDLAVEPGEVVGIVGASGSGKSTLLRLLIGMYRPNGGGVYLDGCAVHQWDRRDLARHVGFLPQEPLLSRGTAAEVIARLERPDMTLVLDAARRAGAHEAIVALPLGYATPVAGQHQFSMGQRHRVAIARALYGRPRVVVLDELAGSLDAEGEAHVARLLGVLREEGTSVVFATHRPALLAVADRVLAIRGGALVPAGGGGGEGQPRLAAAGRPARIARPGGGGGGGGEDGGGRGGGRRERSPA